MNLPTTRVIDVPQSRKKKCSDLSAIHARLCRPSARGLNSPLAMKARLSFNMTTTDIYSRIEI
jgi:hypothetical protein